MNTIAEYDATAHWAMSVIAGNRSRKNPEDATLRAKYAEAHRLAMVAWDAAQVPS